MNQEQLDRIEAKLDLLLERTAPKAPRVRKDPDADPVFDQFWRLYPVKKGKQAAQRAWKNKKTGADFILKDIQTRVRNDRQWIEGFIPHASTYLNGCRWEDEIQAPKVQDTIPKDNELFDMFWKNYPLKKGKQAALLAWNRKKPSCERLMSDVNNRVANDRQWIDGFIPHASTYINGNLWEDEIQAPRVQDSIPRGNDELLVFAIERGMRQPHVGEDWFNYRKYVESKVCQ